MEIASPRPRTIKKIALSALTNDKSAALQAAWEERADDLLNRNGDNPNYPKHFIKHNEPLKAAIQSAFEGFIQVYLEFGMDHPTPHSRLMRSRRARQERDHDAWVINRYAEVACRKIDEVVCDRNLAQEITGSIIGRSICAFQDVFPGFREPKVDDNALEWPQYFMTPDSRSRYR